MAYITSMYIHSPKFNHRTSTYLQQILESVFLHSQGQRIVWGAHDTWSFILLCNICFPKHFFNRLLQSPKTFMFSADEMWIYVFCSELKQLRSTTASLGIVLPPPQSSLPYSLEQQERPCPIQSKFLWKIPRYHNVCSSHWSCGLPCNWILGITWQGQFLFIHQNPYAIEST